jgi:hypothetical protein
MVLPAHAPVDLTLRVGALETAVGYLLDPTSYTGSDQGQAPYFNGQRSRLDIFGGVLETCGCKSIIETGTYLGSTTKYMADTSSLPVYSCETNPVFFAIARKELAAIQNVDLYFGDSRAASTSDDPSSTSMLIGTTIFRLSRRSRSSPETGVNSS